MPAPRRTVLCALALAVAAPAAGHEDEAFHARVDADVSALTAGLEDGTWQGCLDLAEEGRRLAASRGAFAVERDRQREELRALAEVANQARTEHFTASERHGPDGPDAQAALAAWEAARERHEAAGRDHQAFLDERNTVVAPYERRRAAQEPGCRALHAAETRWVERRRELEAWCEDFGRKQLRIASGKLLDGPRDAAARAQAQAGVDAALAAHGCLHPAKAREYRER